MFSRAVVRTDQFLEMPQTAQNLYFHLGMEPDDDGFVNPRMIMRTIGSNDDDLKLLIAKGFVIQFPAGVIVIRHWRQNNYIQKDRYKPTVYKDELKMLKCKDDVYILDTQVRVRLELGKDNIGEKTAGKAGGVEIWDPKTKEERQQINKVQELANFYLELKGWENEDREFYEENEISYPRICKRSKEILELTNGSLEEAKTKVEKIKKWADGNGLEWTLETVQKRWLEIDLLKI
jgi:hypothetical protein